MNHEKKIKVVMLATDKIEEGLVIQYFKDNTNHLDYWSTPCGREYPKKGYTNNQSGCLIPQHLYFLSDEKIINLDSLYNETHEHGWYYVTDKKGNINTIYAEKGLLNYTGGGYYSHGNTIFRKIIATTNPELNLPRPSDSFIQKYVKGYNKSNVIEEVKVEYNIVIIGIANHIYHGTEEPKTEAILKVAPDNTITIKPVVETWDDILDKFMVYYNSCGFNPITTTTSVYMKWLKDNYNPPTKKK